MKKTVIKTALITFACCLGLLAVLFGVFSIFFPKNLGDFADELGNYSVSIFYYEKQYNKTESYEDLYNLVLKINQSDSERAEKYCTLFIESENFNSFISKKDENLSDFAISNKDYIYGKYTVSLFDNGKENQALNFSSGVLESTYKKNNPLSYLIAVRFNSFSESYKTLVKSKLEELRGLIPTSDLTEIERDISIFN